MAHLKTFILIIATILFSIDVIAKNKLAIINDSDGFTNIRSGKGAEFPIIGTIEKDEFFYCEDSDSDWTKVIALKWQDGKQIEGFIHKSRIQLIENLDSSKQKELLAQVLTNQQNLANKFQKAFIYKNSSSYKTAIKELELYSEIKYSPILDILPLYYCRTKDSIMLELFYSTIWADKGSANEAPSYAIGYCFICQPELVLKQVRNLKSTEHRNLILNDIEWGLMCIFDVDQDEKSDNAEYNKLKKRLDNERKKIRS